MVSQLTRLRTTMAPMVLGLGAAGLAGGCAVEDELMASRTTYENRGPCDPGNGGITLSIGFCASVFADNLGHVRDAVVGEDGTLYVNIWSGSYYADQPVPEDGFLVALKDDDRNGKAETVLRYGETKSDGSTGGSGIALYKGYVYAEAGDKIVRYKIPAGRIAPAVDAKPEIVLSGLPTTGDHNMHPFIIDQKGMIFVDVGSPSNSCQPRNRVAEVPGADPCLELQTRAGIWRYNAEKLGQVFSSKERYATGLRNAEGLSFDADGRLFAIVHGRDQLIQNWPRLYPDTQHTIELPAEELVEIKAGGDYGWPTCYYDNFQKKLVLAPEYGGDGGNAVGVCSSKLAPIAAYPSHWAPNDMKIYTGEAFPKPYQGGAFIAFHGSWNRSPGPQAGFNVVFQPMKNGKPSGDYVIFADGFAGADNTRAAMRPMALAVSPDGALYITDDNKGRIWRVNYTGPADITSIASAPKPHNVVVAASPAQAATPLRTPALPLGATAAQLAAGDAFYHAGTCTACHGSDGKGTPVGPDLTDTTWLWGDGSLTAITKVIGEGVSAPKLFRSPMPPGGGVTPSPTDLAAVSAYVWSLSHH